MKRRQMHNARQELGGSWWATAANRSFVVCGVDYRDHLCHYRSGDGRPCGLWAVNPEGKLIPDWKLTKSMKACGMPGDARP